jgi:hypothetical protein
MARGRYCSEAWKRGTCIKGNIAERRGGDRPQGAPRRSLVFVDFRDPRELAREGKIPGAFSCPRGMLEFWIDPESPYAKLIFQQDKTFVPYCST